MPYISVVLQRLNFLHILGVGVEAIFHFVGISYLFSISEKKKGYFADDML